MGIRARNPTFSFRVISNFARDRERVTYQAVQGVGVADRIKHLSATRALASSKLFYCRELVNREFSTVVRQMRLTRSKPIFNS